LSISSGLRQVLQNYSTSRIEEFKDHPLGIFVRHELSEVVRETVGEPWVVKGSVGNGQWAETPWVSVFDPQVTTSAQRGYYVVYLFDQIGRHVYLSLNQATTEIKEQFGPLFIQVLQDRANRAIESLHVANLDGLSFGPIDLTGGAPLTRGYAAGNIAAYRYDTNDFPSDAVLTRDLIRLLDLYATYYSIRSGDIGDEEELPGFAISTSSPVSTAGTTFESPIMPAHEARQFRWHRRAERNQRLARDAKRFHGTKCMVCEFDFGQKYGERGEGYIEAHHVVPFASLSSELEPVLLDPRTDFVVVCANCHRMLHRSQPPITPSELQALLRSH
jgi:5-methylcytosine-specific restriction protein A